MTAPSKTAGVLIVESRFYSDIADHLLQGAQEALVKAGVSYTVVTVPGALEIAPAMAMAESSKPFDGYVALGCIIRGATSHHTHVASSSIHSLQQFAVAKKLAMGIGILTVDNHEQALERALVAKGNRGAAAVHACLSLINHRNRVAR